MQKTKCVPTDFQLIVIDKILMNQDTKIQKKIKGNKESEQIIRNAFNPILFYQKHNKNVFYVLFFNKFFEINIDW